MGRSMLIICAGLLVVLGYVFVGMAGTAQTMNMRNVGSYNATVAQNSALSGIQIAIRKYNESNETWTGPEEVTLGDTDLTLSLQHAATDTIKITSEARYRGAEHTVISTYDISKKLQLVPEFNGALSGVGSNENIEFKNSNGKVHFNGIPPEGTPCPDKPGFTVQNAGMVDKYDEMSEIAGNPPVAVDNSTNFEDIADLIEALAPNAINLESKDDISSTEPGVYFINDYINLSGQVTGYGILVIRNNGILDIASELTVAGQFEFNGLVIFENGSDFKGAGQAQINGSILAASDGTSTFNIQANGNLEAQYDCTMRQYAQDAVHNALHTTVYRQLSIYE